MQLESSIRYSEDGSELMFVPAIATLTISRFAKTIHGSGKGDYAFIGAIDTLTSFEFEENPLLKVIEPYSFYNCKKLVSANLSSCSCLSTIGDYAFAYCGALETIVFPTSNITKILQYSFYCAGIKTLFIPSCVLELGFRAFSECRQLSSISFDKDSKLKQLSGCLFTSCKITNFTAPRLLQSWTGTAFQYCHAIENFFVAEGNLYYYSLEGILYHTSNLSIVAFPASRKGTYTILSGVTSIGGAAFISSKLSQVFFPDSLKDIYSYAFQGSLIENLSFPSSLKTISNNVFGSCLRLTSVIIPEGVYSIGGSCFISCSNLKKIVLPSTLTTLGGAAFSQCSSSLSIEFASDSTYYLDSQYLIIDKGNTTVIQYLGSEKKLIIPETILTIKSSAFRQQTTLEQVTFSGLSLLSTIESYAFYGCTNLISFIIPSSVTKICEYAFEQCKKLTTLSFGPSIQSIEKCAFLSCSSLSVVTFSCDNSFAFPELCFASCFSLRNITFPSKLTGIGINCFDKCYSLDAITIPSSVNYIKESAFSNSGITQCVFLGTSIWLFPSFLFYNCTNLEIIDIPAGVQVIESNCFSFAPIKSLILPESAVSLGDFCFQGCSKMEIFTIPSNSNLESISYGVFSGCVSLRVINNGSPRFEKDNEALFNKGKTKLIVLPPKSNVKYFSFPTTVDTIFERALFGCINLHVVFIPDNSVLDIQPSAFEGCVNLRSINLPSCITQIGINAFKGCTHLQCGLSIDITNPTFLHSLEKNSLLPKRCLKPCINICSHQKRLMRVSALISAFILISVSK